MKKALAVCLCALILLPCLAACRMVPADTPETTNPITDAPETEAPAEPLYEIYEEVIGGVRVQLFSPSVLRIEVAQDGAFCDVNTIAVTNRSDWPGVRVERQEKDGCIQLVTDTYTVVLPADAADADGVSLRSSAGEIIWTGAEAEQTATVNLPDPGDTPAVWSFSDSPRVTVPDNGFTSMIYELDNGFTYTEGVTDHYLFVCDGDPFALRTDYNRLVGACDLVTVKTLGLWFSRYHAYSDTELLALVDTYRERGYPLDFVVCDTDWRVGASVGYDINTEYFPDMAGFFDAMHGKNVSVVLNDHVRFFPESMLEWRPILWFYDNLTEKLNLGLDSWWYDRNWSWRFNCPYPEINPDMMGQMLYLSVGKAHDEPLNKRTVLLSNYYSDLSGELTLPAYVGTHRYSVQWSGDIAPTMLQSELENMVKLGALTSSAYISADLGGHTASPGTELYIRWSQYGALSPIMRYHSGRDYSPWMFGELADEIAHDYIQMRYRLMPLLYNLAHENYAFGLPMARRLDFYYPQYSEAGRNDQYLLGEDILVAPISTGQATADGAVADEREVFIPDGSWMDVFSGAIYTGPQTVTVSHGLNTSPIFVRLGSLTALAYEGDYASTDDWQKMVLDVYPMEGVDDCSALYEDDGVTLDYTDGGSRETALELVTEAGVTTVTVGAAEGKYTTAWTEREWTLRIHGMDVTSVTVNGETVEFTEVPQDPDAAPFAVEGGSPDAAVVCVTFVSPIAEESVIVIR